MSPARRFTFGSYKLDTERSTITFNYEVELEAGGRESYVDVLEFSDARPEMWAQIPSSLLKSLLETLCVMIGINYWKIHCAPEMKIEGFSLTKKQAEFWNTVYTKGLGEYFYRSRKDFRGLISFPFTDTSPSDAAAPFPRRDRALLAQGGGKDSIVSAELLREAGMPFDVFVLGTTLMQERAVRAIGASLVRVRRRPDEVLRTLRQSRKLEPGYPSVTTQLFVAVLAAALYDYRYVIFSNEQSADIPNTTYLGLEVNHQWSKSREAELLVRDYVASHITPDIAPFSLIRQCTEIAMVRRFAAYPNYFFAFSSCNANFTVSDATAAARDGRSYWCNACPKCAFIFSCLSAFLPKETVLDIFGADLYANPSLLPIFSALLGIEGMKPFECVGTPHEMIVAMHRAHIIGSYEGDVAMTLYRRYFPDDEGIEEMEKEVFMLQGESTVPQEFPHINFSLRPR
jgi:UDP-N-acetyl-alpha-D-muramoyl-L-alanyl-L-glutamate epimerase